MQKTNKKSSPGGGHRVKSISPPADLKETLIKGSARSHAHTGNSRKTITTLDGFYGTSPQPFIAYEITSFRIIYANPAFLNLYGYTKKEYSELSVKDLFKLNQQEGRFTNLIKQLQKISKPVSASGIKKNGTGIKLQLYGGKVLAGGYTYDTIYINDITEQSKLGEEKKLFEAVNLAISKAKSAKEGLRNALDCIRTYVGCELVELWNFSQENDYALIEACSFPRNNQVLKKFVADSESVIITMDQMMKVDIYTPLHPVWIKSLQQHPALIRSAKALDAGLKSSIMFPVFSHQKLIGGLFLFNKKEKEYDQGLVDILNAAAIKPLSNEIINRRALDELQSFFNLSGDLLCIAGMDRCLKKINPSFIKLLGFAEKELLGRNLLEFVHEEDRLSTGDAISTLIRQKKEKEFINRFRCSNGEYKWLSWSVAYSEDHQLLLSAARDISQNIKSTEALHKKDEHIQEIFNRISDAFIALDKDFRFTYINRKASEIYGRQSEELIGKVNWEVFPTTINTPFYDACQLAYKKQQYVFVEDYYKAYGRWYENHIYPSPEGISIYFRDVTEKKQAALAVEKKNIELRDAHQELHEIVHNASEIIFKLDENGIILFVSPEFKRSLGYEPEEVIGKHFSEFVHSDDILICQQALFTLMQSGKPMHNIIYRALRKDGLYEWLSTSAAFIFNENGTPKYGIGLTQNITNLRNTLERLEATEQRYAAFLEQSSEAIWRIEIPGGVSIKANFDELLGYCAEHGYLAECNLAYARMYGYNAPEQMEGFHLSQLMPVDNPANLEYFISFIESGFRLTNAESIEYDKEGNIKYILNNLIGIIENEKLIRIWGTQRDITQQTKAQEDLIYKDKLLSVIADSANSLLKEEDYNSILPDILQNLLTATSSDRAYIFENAKNESGELITSQKFECCSNECEPHINNPAFQNIPFRVFRDHLGELQEDAVFSGITGEWENKEIQQWFVQKEIKSLLIVPIIVNQEYWGTIGLEDCHKPRLWSEMDRGVLKTFATSLASAIERRKAGEEILESEARFRYMADTAPVMIWVTDEEDRVTYVNKSWIKFTGITLEDIKKSNWSLSVHPEDVKVAVQEYSEQFKQRLPVLLEYRLKSVTGEYRWVIDQAIPRFLPNGTFLGYIGSLIDIHDRKLSEEKISYQAMVMQEVTEAIISTDLDFNVITWNKGAELIHGVKAEDIISHPIRSQVNYFYINETREQALLHLYSYDYWSGEVYFDRKDGRRIYLYSALSFITNNKGSRIGFVGVHRDITDRRKSEEALRISEERHRSVVHALGEGILLLDSTRKIITTNRSAETILGLSAEQLKGHSTIDSTWSAIHEDGSPFPPEQHPSLITLQTGQSLQNIMMGIDKPDGSLTWISINTEPLYYSDQRVTPDAVVASFVDITQKKMAEMELQRNERQLREYSDRINNILDSITDGFIAVDNEMKVFLWNRVFENNTGIRSIDAMGKKLIQVFPDLEEAVYHQFEAAIHENKTVVQDYFIAKQNMWFETTAFPSLQGLFIYFRDITKRKRQESLLALEKEVLELNARPQASLKSTTDFLLEGIERMFPGMLCSVICLQEDDKTIETLSAPSIPSGYSKAIEGLKIGPNAGSCGTSMYLKKNVIVEDLATDERWKDHKNIALQYQFRACWSFPILSSQNKVLASFAIHHVQVKSPSPEELLVIERTVNILRVIIENKQSEEKIKISNERYLLATMATNDAIWDWDVATNSMYWGEGFHGLFGYKAGYFDNELGMWEASIHPHDKERVLQSIQRFVESHSQQVWQDEYRFRKADGKYVLVADRGFLIYNQQGKVSRMVGSMQDVTEKREMEKKLLNQELNKQKLIAQAVVDAQEKERSLIGKELHDNINQILSTAKLYLEVARTDEKERDGLIDMSANSISNAINEIRTISRSLVPSSIGDLGLVESLQDLVESIKLTRKLHVEFFHYNDIDMLISEQQKLMLFRITQEQVNNVMKHSNAKNLVIELLSEDDTINMSISDDGDGFDLDQVKHKKGVGLSNITSRAELFNGKVKIDTAPGKGCTLNIYIPISNL